MGFEPTVSECFSSASEADALIRTRLRAQVPKPFWFTVKGFLGMASDLNPRRRSLSSTGFISRGKHAGNVLLFRRFEDEVRSSVDNALKEKGYPQPELELLAPNKEGLGDLSCAVSLKLARELKRPPYLDSQGAGGVDLRQGRDAADSLSSGAPVGLSELHPQLAAVRPRDNHGGEGRGGVARARGQERPHRAHERQPKQVPPYRARPEPCPGGLAGEDNEEARQLRAGPELHRRLGRAGRRRHRRNEVPRVQRRGPARREV